MRGKKLSVEQSKWLQAYGIKDTKPYLVQKNTSELLQLIYTTTGNIIKFRKIQHRRDVTLELISTDNKGREL